MIVRNPDKVLEYVLMCDRELEEDKQTVFHYKPASLDDQYDLLDNNLVMEKTKDGSTLTKMSFDKSKEVGLLLNCITQIDNLRDGDGEELKWLKGNNANNKKVLSVVPAVCRLELVGVIRSGDELGVEEVKN